MKNWHYAKHRKTHGLNLRRAPHGTVQQLDEQREKETEREPRTRSSGDDKRPVRPVRLVGKVWRLDEGKALGALLVRKPGAALGPQQVRGNL